MSDLHERSQTPPPGGYPEVEQVVAMAHALADEEFNRAERFDRKALNLATVVGAFYSLSQIVVANALTTKDLVSESVKHWLLGVGLAATVLAAISVGAALLVFRARSERAANPDDLQPWLAAALRGDPVVTERIVRTYKAVAVDRRKSNKTRTDRYRLATVLSIFAVAATAGELGLVLLAIT